LKPPPFTYLAPQSLEEALSMLAEHGDEAKPLAGGQSLVPLLALRLARPETVIDLGGVPELAYIRADNGHVAIGAMTRERVAERSEIVRSKVPLLADALPLIGHVAIRNRGTIGGSASHADPAAEIPTMAMAVQAEFVAASAARGTRTIPAAEFFQGFLTTALEPDELLVEIRFPVAPAGTMVAFQEAARRHGDFAMVGVATSVLVRDGSVADARIALAGVSDMPLRCHEAEEVLTGSPPSVGAIDEAASVAAADLTPGSDLHGSSAYRKHIARVLVRRALLPSFGLTEEK
jgi:aerobic carbon-monoxide dehydrogenase medium subunit